MQSVLTRPQRTVIQPQGALNATNASEFGEQLIGTIAEDAVMGLTVDLSKVESLDSAGLMVLVSTLTTAQKLGKSFTLAALPAQIRIIFEVTQLDRAFEIVDSVEEVI